jgi:hypothetical protein
MIDNCSCGSGGVRLRIEVPPFLSHSLSRIQSEADLHCYLPVGNHIVFEVATHLGDLEPLHVSDCLASSRDRIVHRLVSSKRN